VKVLLPVPLDGLFDYDVVGEEGESVRVGQLVRVPFGTRRLTGCVWQTEPDKEHRAYQGTLKRGDSLGGLFLADTMRAFIDWSAAWTCSPRGGFLRLALGGVKDIAPYKPLSRLVVADGGGTDMESVTPHQSRVLQQLRGEGVYRNKRALARACGVSDSVVEALVRRGIVLSRQEKESPRRCVAQSPLNDEQQRASNDLVAQMGEGFDVGVLQGVTGSGKTWVYFDRLRDCLEGGRQGLVLLPEIMLTQRWLDHCRSVLGYEPLVWHSGLGASARQRVWHQLMRGEGHIVVGARSALFLPMPRLGLIVVDEEHDSAYKQEEGLIYNARDLAVVRARQHNIHTLLVSATPSLESMANVWKKRYHHVSLATRFRGATMPTVALIDMAQEKMEKGTFLSPSLVEAMKVCLHKGEQVLLFLNRRGYAPLTVCGACGHWLVGPQCHNRLVQHRYQGMMLCHYCGYHAPIPDACPKCGKKDSWRACGPGVDRLEEEVARRFAGRRIQVLSSDRLTDVPSMAQAVQAIEKHEVDIIIGTQMVAKGHHFPLLTLVGVVDVDAGLGGVAGGDLRASERMFQVLQQVAGRAGRAENTGHVLLQTYTPSESVLRFLVDGDSDGFLRHEARQRQELSLPPFGGFAALIVSAMQDTVAAQTAKNLARAFRQEQGVRLLGPSKAPIAMIRGYHRWRLLVKADDRRPLAPLVRRWIKDVPIPSAVRLRIDIDPLSFL